MASSWTGDYIEGDKITQYGDHNTGKKVTVPRTRHNAESVTPRPPNEVLVLMSNPRGTDPLRLLDEYRHIEQAIRAARYRDRLRLVTGAAPRYYDLQSMLSRCSPVVVHFSGHGSGTGGILLADRDGDPVDVPPDALAGTLRLLGGTVRCVVLNACLTRPQAEAFAHHVPCVVGTSRAIPDPTAIQFAGGFYAGVADGQSVAAAYERGRNLIDLGGRAGADTLVLVERSDGAARRTFLHD